MPVHYQNYINGKWVDSVSGKTFKSFNPANTDEIIGVVPASDHRDVYHAVRAAKKAFEQWRLVPAPKRGDLLFEVAERLKKEKERIGDIVCKEMGKVKKESHGDVQEAIDMAYYMAGEGRRLFGDTVHSELPNKDIKTVRVPIGVFGLITPWNFPVAIPAWKILPALVCGNTVVFKPASLTPCVATEFVKIFDDAGIPPGVLNLVHGFGTDVGEAILKHPDVRGVSFTGSAAVGRRVAELCGPRFAKFCLEMGGKNVIIIMDDADLDLAVEGCIWAGFGTTGQRCTAGSRVVVHKKVHDEFLKKFVAAAKKLKLGDGLDKDTDIGPLVSQDAVDKVQRYMDIAKSKDKVTFMCGGKKAKGKGLDKGYFFEPTILANVKPHHIVAQEEIFGPVVSVLKTNDLYDALEIANSVQYGLSASIFTKNIQYAHIAARELQTGIVYINTSTIGAEVHTPFGGVKNTGNGHREAGGQGGAIETYTEMKVINVDYSGKIQKAQGIDWGKK
ncbi:aldehyde dehydrogenase family protein [Candidatus Woesearchaeota archaeon]|nr:aldehyde dehydrogenase family protein [Candidatus Woesearchaeota archaeon]